MAARADILGDTGGNCAGALGRRAGRRRPARHRDPVRPRRRTRPALRSRARRAAGPLPRGAVSLSYLDLNATPAVQLRPRPFRLPRPAVAAGDEGLRRGTRHPAPATALEPGEFILGYPGRRRARRRLPQPEVLSRNGSYMAYRRLEEHVGLFRDYLREQRRDARRAGAARGEVHGPLAQRRTAGAGSRQRTIPNSARTRMRNNDFNYKEMDPHGYAVPARLARPPAQPARHRAQHEPAPDDPARRDLRARPTRRRARRRQGPRHRRLHHLRQPGPPVRVRPERLDQRQDISTNSATSTTRSAAHRTARSTSPSRSGRSARCTKGCPPSPRSAAAPISSCPGSSAMRYLRDTRRAEGSTA